MHFTGNKFRVLDADGNPVNNAKIHTYEAGGTTPKASHTTRARDVEHANPIRTGPDGCPTAGAVFLGAGITRVVVTDEDDAALPDGDVEIAQSVDADDVTFTQDGDDAVERTGQERLRDTVHITDYDADPTGSAASTDAIVAAIADLPATGGTIYFPKGTYKTAEIVLPLYPKCIRLIGEGRENSILIPAAANQKLFSSAGQVTGVGGVRFTLERMGIKPHASGSTGMAVDMRDMSGCLFRDWGFLHNGSATWAVGVELYSQDSGPGASNCYYNVFENTDIMPEVGLPTLPVKQAVKIYGSSGNHIFHRLKLGGPSPTPTIPLVSIASYCRQNIFADCHFEGTLLTTASVFEDAGYGTKIQAYFENSGNPYYSAAEIESGTREWSVLEKCAFAQGSVDASSDALMNGAIVRDCYAFGSDADALAFIYRQEKIQRTESVAFNYTGTATLKARTRWLNAENFYLTMNDNGAGARVVGEGVAGLLLQTTSLTASVGLVVAATGAAAAAITYTVPLAVDQSGNVSFNGQAVGTSGLKVLAIANGTAPSTSPAGGGQLYCESGALKWRGSGGTITTLGAA